MAPLPPDPLLSVRAAVVMVLAVITGVLAGILAYLAEPSAPRAVLVAAGAAGGALLLFHAVIDRR